MLRRPPSAMDKLLGRKARPELKPPDTLARYVCVKHAWYKKYRRIFCITPSAIHTQNPERTLVLTNSYSFVGDSDVESVALGGDEFEFVISARQDKRVRGLLHAQLWAARQRRQQQQQQRWLVQCIRACRQQRRRRQRQPAPAPADPGLLLLLLLQGKFKPLKFTCRHRQLLLTDLFQCMAAASAVGRCAMAAKMLG